MATLEWGWDVFVAVGTIGLAVFTAALAHSTRRLAEATTADGQAQWRPVVIVTPDTSVGFVDTVGELRFGIRNVGRGPAFGVHAQVRFGSNAAGASVPQRGALILTPNEETLLHCVVSEDRRADVGKGYVIDADVSYYDLGERFHTTRFRIVPTTQRRPDGRLTLRVASNVVNETDLRLLPVHGSLRAQAEEDRRNRRLLGRACSGVVAAGRWLAARAR